MKERQEDMDCCFATAVGTPIELLVGKALMEYNLVEENYIEKHCEVEKEALLGFVLDDKD